MADFTVEGIVSVDVSRGIRDLTRFDKKLNQVTKDARELDRELKKIDIRFCALRIKVDVYTASINLL